MRKKIGIVIIATMMATLVACGNDDKTGSAETSTVAANNQTENNTQENSTQENNTQDNDTQENTTEEPTTEKPVVNGEFVTVVEEGCTYFVKSTGTTLNPGEEIPAVPGKGDKYETVDYTYTYGVKVNRDQVEAWNVVVKDVTKETYGEIVDGIGDISVTHMVKTFMKCKNLVKSPEIPAGVTTLNCTYFECEKLVEIPVLPESIVDMDSTFHSCIKLETAPVIPKNVTRMPDVFFGCKALVQAPVLPEGVTYIRNLFANCEKLEMAPEIPESVTDMYGTFKGCVSLKQAPIIPASVTQMMYTFNDCTGLTGTITINATPEAYADCLKGIDLEEQNITLEGESGRLRLIMQTASN